MTNKDALHDDLDAGGAARVAAIYRYPVKGFSPQPLARVDLEPDRGLPFDRAYAVENGIRSFDPDHPRWLPKAKFLQLMSHERLAALETRFDEATHVLTVLRDGKQVARGALDQPLGRRLIEQFLAAFLGAAARGAPHIVSAGRHSFSDVAAPVMSVINLASVRDLERVIGRPVDPLRFRANVYLDGLDAWSEFGWLGRRLALDGQSSLEVMQRIGRCAATNVEPGAGRRDLQIPRTLAGAFGHEDMGIYARVATAATLRVGSTLLPLSPSGRGTR